MLASNTNTRTRDGARVRLNARRRDAAVVVLLFVVRVLFTVVAIVESARVNVVILMREGRHLEGDQSGSGGVMMCRTVDGVDMQVSLEAGCH